MSDASTVLIGNHCHHNAKSGIGFAACEAGRSLVINNRVVDNALVAVGINPGWKVTLTDNEFSRKGGLPPIVMVFAGSEATFTNNVIRGEGVAGIRTAGIVRADNNSFEGLNLRKVGPPNFGVWALKGAKVTLLDNRFSNWRHAVNASEAELLVTGNTVNSFHRAAIVISNPPKPAVVTGNIAVSSDPMAAVVTINGEPQTSDGNRLSSPEQDESTR